MRVIWTRLVLSLEEGFRDVPVRQREAGAFGGSYVGAKVALAKAGLSNAVAESHTTSLKTVAAEIRASSKSKS